MTIYTYIIIYIEEGFCDYEEFTSEDDRGNYNWTEQAVDLTTPQRQGCFYEPQNEATGIGSASRVCAGNLDWQEYNGLQCITEQTFLLRELRRSLAEVGFDVPVVGILAIACTNETMSSVLRS